MSRRLAIRGLGVVGGFGCGREALTKALQMPGHPNGSIRVATSEGDLSFPAYLADLTPLDQFMPKRKMRRADRFSKMAVLSALLALRDADLHDVDMSRVGMALGTGYGGIHSTFRFIDSAIEFGDSGASPTVFSYSGNSGALSTASIVMGMTGPSLTVSQFELSFASALISARQWLLEGRIDVVLVGGLDEYCDVLGYCRERFFGAFNRGPVEPLKFEAQSAVVGEGCAFLALTRDEGPAPTYGYIDNVCMGHGRVPITKMSDNAWAILGADGHKSCGQYYAREFESHDRIAAYAPVYGSMPAGMAVDAVIGALVLRSGKIPHPPYTTPGAEIGLEDDRFVLCQAPLCCVKFDCHGYYAMIHMSHN